MLNLVSCFACQVLIRGRPGAGGGGGGTRTNQRTLNLLKNRNALDGHRVKIINSDFVNNISSDNIAGLISSAYSLSISNCLFERNSARAIVFVYNHEAVVGNTMFVENTALDFQTQLHATDCQQERSIPEREADGLGKNFSEVRNLL